MPTRRQYLGVLTTGVAGAMAGCGENEPTTIEANGLSVSSAAFEHGGSIPPVYTADGANRSPPLTIESVPTATESFALVVDDPDAGNFVHWLLWNVPGEERAIPEGLPNSETITQFGDARQGTNGFGTIGYRGPAPPEDDPPHTYRFILSALDDALSVSPGSNRNTLESAMEGRLVGRTQLTATYDR